MEALISGRAGLAVVVDGDHLASIHGAEPGRTVPRQRHEIPFLLGEARDFVAVENIDREEIVRRLALAQDREDGLQLALIAQDAELPADIRREAAVELEELLADGEVIAAVEGVLYAAPLPEEADRSGATALASAARAERVLALLDRLGRHQAEITEVRRAWDAVPPEAFAGAGEARRVVAVGEGLFRDLVLRLAEGRPRPTTG